MKETKVVAIGNLRYHLIIKIIFDYSKISCMALTIFLVFVNWIVSIAISSFGLHSKSTSTHTHSYL